jgi:hypothetical protein
MKRLSNATWGAPLAIVLLPACARTGPLPAVTGASAVPVEQPGVELQSAAVPGFFWSEAVKEHPDGDPIKQASVLVEPGKLIKVPGLAAGVRYVEGRSGDGHFEPMLRYRLWLDDADRLGLAFIAFGAHASGGNQGASYSLTRGGLELGVDVRVTPISQWAELHGLCGTSFMVLTVDGRYCTNSTTGFSVSCPDQPPAREIVDTEILGVYPAFFSGGALDFGRHLESAFHGFRVATWLGGGFMPHVRNGGQTDHQHGWASVGLGLTLGLGGS